MLYFYSQGSTTQFPVTLTIPGYLDAAGESNGSVRRSPKETIESDLAWKLEPIVLDGLVNRAFTRRSGSAVFSVVFQTR